MSTVSPNSIKIVPVRDLYIVEHAISPFRAQIRDLTTDQPAQCRPGDIVCPTLFYSDDLIDFGLTNRGDMLTCDEDRLYLTKFDDLVLDDRITRDQLKSIARLKQGDYTRSPLGQACGAFQASIGQGRDANLTVMITHICAVAIFHPQGPFAWKGVPPSEGHNAIFEKAVDLYGQNLIRVFLPDFGSSHERIAASSTIDEVENFTRLVVAGLFPDSAVFGDITFDRSAIDRRD